VGESELFWGLDALHTLFFHFIEAEKVLLGVTAYLAASPGADMFFNQSPVFAKKF